jgi:hypothetical protein
MGNDNSVGVRSGKSGPNFADLAMGDAMWEQRKQVQRETDVAMDWPADLLLSFSLRMSVHGMSLSRTLMLCDRRYAMQQLMFAHSLPDKRLQQLAAELLVHFEERQIGRPALH